MVNKSPFVDNPVSPAYSATRAGCRIYQRSLKLCMKDTEPMTVSSNQRGRTKFIIDALVNSLLREAASVTLNLKRGHPEL